MHLYLIRHAHTEVQQTIESSRWGLSAKGLAQAERLAALPFWDEVQQIVVSSEVKTRLTIEPLLRRRALPVKVDARFDELHRPSWVTTEEYIKLAKRAFAEPASPAGAWESAASAQQRFLTAIADLCQNFAGQTVALVGHGITLSLYRAYLLGQTRVDVAEWQHLGFGAVALVDPLAGKLVHDFQPVTEDDKMAG